MVDYESKTVVELKKLLKTRGLDQTGRKAELVQRLKDNDNDDGDDGAETKKVTKTTSSYYYYFFFWRRHKYLIIT